MDTSRGSMREAKTGGKDAADKGFDSCFGGDALIPSTEIAARGGAPIRLNAV